VEHDADAVATHRANVGPCDLADITTWSSSGPASLVVGGVPCQSFSDAGDRRGLDDPRGCLFEHLVRVAVESRAEAVLLENVRGLVTWELGRALLAIIEAFRAAGFDPAWHLLNAADYGVPQRRIRLFVVGFRSPLARAAFRWPEPTHAQLGGLFGLAPWVTVREALGLRGAFDAGHLGGGGWQGMRALDVDAPGYAVAGRSNADKLSPLDRPASAQVGHHDVHQDGAVRLSAKQCAALQGFPAGFEFMGNKTSQHRQIGNAVPPALGEAIGHAVRAALAAQEAA
jgi:DNA (cytosine-5)-methyltransferase 1